MPNAPAMGGGPGGGMGQPFNGMPQGMPGQFGDHSQAVNGIAKNMSWKLLFFSAACCTSAASIIAVVYMFMSMTVAPCSFTAALFMLMFGVLQMMLDFPIPHPSPVIQHGRINIYKFFLFLTRFTGRGMWYLFLGTMIFASLYDLDISPFFGICLGGYVGLLGLVTFVFGFQLSSKLDRVRQALMTGEPKPSPPQGWTQEMFKMMAQDVARVDFTEDELVYVFNSLAFEPSAEHDLINANEYSTWIQPGKMEIV